MQTHAIRLLASAAEKRAWLGNSAAFWQPSCRVVTFHSIVTSTMMFLARALKFSSRVLQAIEVLASVALVSLVAQAWDVKLYDLCSSTKCRKQRTVCACARIAVNVTSIEFVTSQSNVLSDRERPRVFA